MRTDSGFKKQAKICSTRAERPPLRSWAFLEGLTKAETKKILGGAMHAELPAKSVITEQGEPGDHLFLLTEGVARFFFTTEDGRKVILRWLLPGETLGFAALLPTPTCYLVSTEIVEHATAWVWTRRTIRALAMDHPKLLDNALSSASEYLTWFVASHLALISRSARERLALVLQSLAHGIGRAAPNGIRLEVTNEQLANAANITLFTASRLLNEWSRKGLVTKARGNVTIHRNVERQVASDGFESFQMRDG